MARKYIKTPLSGDPGPTTNGKYRAPLDFEQERAIVNDALDTLTDEQLFDLALKLGVNVTDALGIMFCYEHYEMKLLNSKSTAKFNYATDIVWCKNCFQFFRRKVSSK